MSSQPSNRGRLRLLFRRSAIGLGLVSLSAAVTTLTIEGAVRLISPQQLIRVQPELWQPADSVGHVRRPNVAIQTNTGERTVTVRTDAAGFRVGARGRRDQGSRVLLIGDSFMEALQVEHEQSTAYLLERELEREIGLPIVVRNAGVSDWDPNQYLIRARSLLAGDHYSLLVVSIFVGNDAVRRRQAYFPPRAPYEPRHVRLPRSLSFAEFTDALLKPLNDELEMRSHLFVLLKRRLSVLRMRLGLTAEYFPAEYRRVEAESSRWAITAEIAREIDAVADSRGVPTLFFLVPEAFQVYSEDFREYVLGFGIDPTTVDVDQPSRLLERELSARGLQVIQLLDVFRDAASSSPRLFGTVDHHLTPEGHALLTRLVAPHALRLLRP